MSKHISRSVEQMIADSLERTGNSDIDYDVSMAVIPGPQGPQPILAITMVIPALTLGDNHSGCVLIQPAIPPQEAIDDMVRQMVEGLKNAREKAGQQTLAQSNGHGDPKGLIVPGS